jgi:hypothetical protein
MPMPGRNPFHSAIHGLALQPQSVTSAVVNGETILEPWKKGRWLTFIFIGGAWAATVNGSLEVHGLKRSDGTTWEALKEADGTTTLEFDPTLLDDAGVGEAGHFIGSLDLTHIDGSTYKAVRLVYEEDGAAAALVGAAYYISDLYTQPGGDTDYLYAKTRYTDA